MDLTERNSAIEQPTPYGTVPWDKITGLPSILTTSPLTGGGDLSVDRTIDFVSSITANYVLAGATSGGASKPAFRLLVAADIPNLASIYAPLAGSPVFTSPIQAFQVTSTQKNAISNPTEGMVVYDTSLHKLCVRGAIGWETITSA